MGELSPSKNSPSDLLIREYKGWQNPLVYGFFMLVLGLVITVIGKKALHEQTVADVGTVTALLGALLIAVKGFLLVTAQSRQHQVESNAFQNELPAKPGQRVLNAEPASVTENTTKHLDAVLDEHSRDTQPT